MLLDDPASVGSVALNFDSTTGGLIFDKTSRQYLRLSAVYSDSGHERLHAYVLAENRSGECWL
ncbi:hypothetical protein EAO14_28195 [Klebsiella pneumoniae]|nr:hypothetical protein EAO14_28195 [Klebsiella pneumoniae]